MTDAYIVIAKRSAVAKIRGGFSQTRPDSLIAELIKETLDLVPNLDKSAIDDVIIGCAMPEAEQGWNIGRVASLLAGLPDTVPGVTVNRLCSSGLQAIAMAANAIKAKEANIIVAGGVESMSMIPMVGNKPSVNPAVYDDNIGIAYGMGMTAEKVADKWKISREMQDEFAVESHKRSLKAQADNTFDDEIIPIEATKTSFDLLTDKIVTSTKIISKDEGPREGSTVEILANLRAVFAQNGSVTAANSSQMSDGAGVVLVCSKDAIDKYKLTPIAKFLGFDVCGVAPEYMGIGPLYAIPKVLQKLDLKQSDIGWLELNEAFAAQSVAVINELKLKTDVVNPLGGAISLGHPLGATGAIRTATLLHGMQRTNQKYGMVSMCIGVGMGAAGVFENLQ